MPMQTHGVVQALGDAGSPARVMLSQKTATLGHAISCAGRESCRPPRSVPPTTQQIEAAG